ncbi:DUF7133 domain-containing protein [Alienimonas chondri]|uniref:Cytochrome c domain-containing protein n=1 Tax=Alienimonas chondri TaxID=2681879 RepID=A0ABX1VKR2_9PLAN|nr:c-type cytochrome [Alienimonas chondri]NNJ27980.1 hypothetical protein [Alienimonas chondri]
MAFGPGLFFPPPRTLAALTLSCGTLLCGASALEGQEPGTPDTTARTALLAPRPVVQTSAAELDAPPARSPLTATKPTPRTPEPTAPEPVGVPENGVPEKMVDPAGTVVVPAAAMPVTDVSEPDVPEPGVPEPIEPAAETEPSDAGPAAPPRTADLIAPPGFRAVEFAGDDLAHDVFCLTHDANGEVVVSGPGFVKRLLDTDGDGIADKAQLFADGPKSGAQGLFFHGNDLLCTGDGGLLRYRDADGDGVWDGLGKTDLRGDPVQPDRFVKFRTGGEHDVHAIRRGPDGWWYLIAGNYSGVGAEFITRASSPVPKTGPLAPKAGVLMRLTPDLTGGEIVAHGMRNAYDFDFHPLGDAFTYDSDGEREVTMPWYRPTRVLALAPGSHAGWLSRSVKRPFDAPSMPPVVCELGRGSPTGVVCYRHTAFPKELHDSVIVADWTFGRVVALPLEQDGAGYATEPISLMKSSGLAGFAPTAMSVGPRGDLCVSVGGRGTRGAVYRLIYEGEDSLASPASPSPLGGANPLTSAPPNGDGEAEGGLTTVLTAPQPLSSWSRATWEPLVREIGPAPLRAAALDQARPVGQRVRAIEILTEKFGGLPANVLPFFASDPEPAVRARVCWAHAVREPNAPDAAALAPFLADDSPRVRRAALEALAGMTDSPKAAFATAIEPVAADLGHPDRLVRSAAQRVIARLSSAELQPLARAAHGHGDAARVTFALGYLQAYPRFDDAAIRLALNVLDGDAAPDVRRDAVRLVQVALGDYGPSYKEAQQGNGSAFEGYTAGFDLAPHERALNPLVPRLSMLLARRRQGREEAAVDHELVRVAAMIAPYNPVILGELCARLTETSEPDEDLHHLFAAARLPVERSAPQTEAIAAALVNLDAKVAARGLNTDTNWEPRLKELYDALFKRDPRLAAALIERPDFGRPAHVALLENVPGNLVPRAREKFAAAASDPDYEWTGDVVFLLGAGPGGAERIRPLYENRAVRSAVVMSLANDPQSVDRAAFVESLDNGDLSVATAALGALEILPPSSRLSEPEHAAEVAALTALLRRLPDDARGRKLKTQTVNLLRRNTGETAAASADPTSPAAATGWTQYVAARFPDLRPDGAAETAARLARIDWDAGDSVRGATVFTARGCATCHGGRGAVGPDLSGAGSRYGRADRWTAILDPSRDVPSRYRTELIVTADGKVLEGLVVYQSVDGVTLRDAQGRTWRVEAKDILERTTGSNSLMPSGVMDDATDQDWADLDAYLRSL